MQRAVGAIVGLPRPVRDDHVCLCGITDHGHWGLVEGGGCNDSLEPPGRRSATPRPEPRGARR